MGVRASMLIAAAIGSLGMAARAQMPASGEGAFRDLYKELIEMISLMNGRHFLYEIVKLYSNEP